MTLTVYARDGALVFRSADYFLELFGRRLLPAGAGSRPARSTSPMPSCPTANSASRSRSSIRASACCCARWPCSGRLRHDLPTALDLDRHSARDGPVRHPLSSRADRAAGLAAVAAPRAEAARRAQPRSMRCCSSRSAGSSCMGFWAMLVIAVLAAEVVITLMDFVEEDLSRKLPASERVTHTLLAINYGAILALLVPVLVGWASAADRDRASLVRDRQRAGAAGGSRRRSCSACAISSRRAARSGWCVGDAAELVGGAAGPAARADHRRDRLHRPPARRGAGGRGPRGDRAGARSRQGCDAAPAVPAGDEPRSDRERHPDRHGHQFRRRADRQRPVDAAQAPADSRLAAAHDARRRPPDRSARAPARRADQRLGDRLVRHMGGRAADRVRRRQALLRPSRLRGLGARRDGRPNSSACASCGCASDLCSAPRPGC